MIVSHSLRFIFVHLHKTAGTSVMEALLPHLSDDDIVIGSGENRTASPIDPSAIKLHKHSPALRISQAIGEKTWGSYFKFSFVRHPLDRLVSLYEFFNLVRRNNTKEPGILKRIFSLPPERPWESCPDKPPWSWHEMQALLNSTNFSEFIRSKHLTHAQGAKPQAHSLTNRRGELMVDFVGKLENITEDWKVICNRLDIDRPLPNTNSSERQFQDVRRYWCKGDLEFASKKYNEDFELFGYSTDGFLDP